MTNLRTRATGAGQFSSPPLILTNSAGADQGVKKEREPSPAGGIPSGGAQISRRSVMNMVVGATAVLGAMPVAAMEPDPVFAAIEAHRKAQAAVNFEVLKNDDLEAAIPKQKRTTLSRDTLSETYDPKWLEHKRALWALFDTETEATCELAAIVPTSTRGMLALLEYTFEVEQHGDAWPDLFEDEKDRWGHPFQYFVQRNVIESLRSIAA